MEWGVEVGILSLRWLGLGREKSSLKAPLAWRLEVVGLEGGLKECLKVGFLL